MNFKIKFDNKGDKMHIEFDLHTHTIASGHAYSTLLENIDYAKSIGLKLLGMSDHAPKMPGASEFLYFANLKVIPRDFPSIKILKGVELNILDINGTIDLEDRILRRLDFATASLHSVCIPFGTLEENTEALINTIKNPNVNIIGHPGDPRYPFDIKKVVDVAISNNTLLEINNASLNPRSVRSGGEQIILEIIKECRKNNFPIILGSDAHINFDIGNFNNIYPLLEEVNMPEELILNTSVDKLYEFLQIK